MNQDTKLRIPDLGPEIGDREMTRSAMVTVNTCLLIKDVLVCGSRIAVGRDKEAEEHLAEAFPGETVIANASHYLLMFSKEIPCC